MKFEPKTEKQIAEEGMLPDGTVCDFEVLEAEDAVSKAGNEMIALRLKVWRPNGGTLTLRDWLVSTQQGKVLAFAKATGMREAYDAGSFDARDLAGKCGKVKLGVDPEKDGYPARNKVAGYVSGPTEVRGVTPQRAAARSGPAKSNLDDEIPF